MVITILRMGTMPLPFPQDRTDKSALNIPYYETGHKAHIKANTRARNIHKKILDTTGFCC